MKKLSKLLKILVQSYELNLDNTEDAKTYLAE